MPNPRARITLQTANSPSSPLCNPSSTFAPSDRARLRQARCQSHSKPHATQFLDLGLRREFRCCISSLDLSSKETANRDIGHVRVCAKVSAYTRGTFQQRCLGVKRVAITMFEDKRGPCIVSFFCVPPPPALPSAAVAAVIFKI